MCTADRESFLTAITEKIRAALTAEAIEKKLLFPGEQIVVSVSIQTAQTPILAMRLTEFFSEDRIQQAEVELLFARRICNALFRGRSWSGNQILPTHPVVGDVINTSAVQLLKITSFGDKSLEALLKILATEGLELKP